MTPILGLDLGKFKSVSCLYDPSTLEARYSTITTDPDTFRKFLERERPNLVVFETCTIAGWVADLCAALGLASLVANPMNEAWQWRKIKHKTDRAEALACPTGDRRRWPSGGPSDPIPRSPAGEPPTAPPMVPRMPPRDGALAHGVHPTEIR